MKIIKYNMALKVNCGTEEVPEMMEVLSRVELEYSEENLAIAQAEAYNGVYTVEEDGRPAMPTQLDRVEAQVAYTAMMTDTLLEE